MATQTLWTEDATVTDVSAGDGTHIVVRKGGDTREITEVNSFNPVRTHTAKSDYTIELPYDESVEAWEFGDLFLYYGGEFLFRGEVRVTESDERASVTTVEGPDVAVELETGGARVTYTDIAAHDAIDDYGNTYTPFDWSVTAPDTTLVVEDENVQSINSESEWVAATTIGAETPVGFFGDRAEVLQVCFTTEGETPSARDGSGVLNVSSYTDGAATRLPASGGYAEYEFTPAYEIPDGETGLRLRMASSGLTDTVTVKVDGTTLNQSQYDLGGPSWIDIDTSALSGWDSTTHTVRVELAGNESETLDIDVVAPHDTRYSYTWDDSVHESEGHLDGPELYPDSVQFELDEVEFSSNIIGASGNLAAEVSSPFEVAYSNDGGTTYVADPGTSTPSVTFSNTVGVTIRARITMGRFGGPQDATPRFGHLAGFVEDWSIDVDGNDLPVIDALTLESDHLTNMQTLHERFGGRFVLHHKEDALTAESFQPGDVAKTADWEVNNRVRRSDVTDYYNRVTVRGAHKTGDSGPRWEATVQDDAAVAELGEMTYTTTDPSLGGRPACVYRARTLLSEFLAERSLTGDIETVATMVDPGYSYPVEEWNGAALRGGYSLDFDGDGDHVTIGEPLVVTEPITLSAWVEFADWSSTGAIVSGGDPYFLWYDSAHGNLRFEMNDGTTYFGNPQYDAMGNLSLDTPYHLTATYDGTTAKLYVDGDEVASSATSRSIDTTDTDPFSVGRWKPNNREFTGVIDDPRVYDRALSSAEASTLAGGDDVDGELLSWYRFEEGDGTTASNEVADDFALRHTGTGSTTIEQAAPVAGWTNTSELTLACRVKTPSAFVDWDDYMRSDWGTSGGFNVDFSSNETVRFGVRGPSLENWGIGHGPLETDTWYRIIGVFDRPDHYLYVYGDDGMLIASGSRTSDVAIDTDEPIVSRAEDNQDVAVDHFVADDVAWTQSELDAFANDSTVPPSAFLHWNFDGGSGDAEDQSGNGNTGAVANAEYIRLAGGDGTINGAEWIGDGPTPLERVEYALGESEASGTLAFDLKRGDIPASIAELRRESSRTNSLL